MSAVGGEIGAVRPYVSRQMGSGGEIGRPPGHEDAAIEAAALRLLLALHPAQLTAAELAQELGGSADFATRDAVERAVRDLSAAGLVHRSGDLLLPSRAALRLDELLG